jgi:hypothetical protein
MRALLIALVALAAGIAALLAMRSLRAGAGRAGPESEAVLLEEAVITEPVAPGMEGRAEIRKPDTGALVLRVRATDAAQAFARGSRVRVIDLRDGCCVIESADEEHLVR